MWYTGLVPELHKRKPNVACSICGAMVYRRPGELEKSQSRVYCSLRCYGISQRKETPCVICGKLILGRENKKTCSRECSNKNRTGIKYTGRPLKDKVQTIRMLKRRIFTARGIKCERCEFAIQQVLQLHHKDRNKHNNALENLEVLCPNCHASEHYLKT